MATNRTILTSDVASARDRFVDELERALKTNGLDRERAAQQLSSLISSVWNQLEREAMKLPAKVPLLTPNH
jgi:hypothetical protein